MSSRSNSFRPRLEHLEERCTPGSVLDLLADPLQALTSESGVALEAVQTAASPLPSVEQPPTVLPPAREVHPPVPLAASPRPADAGAGSTDGKLLALVGLAGTTTPAQVTFKGSLEGTVIRTPSGPVILVDIEATGTATHLGQFTLQIPGVVNPVARTAVGTYEFTAANGDTVRADFTGQATPTATPGVLSIVETATITGGTGRFAGATGSFTVQRLFDSVASTTVGSFEGTISSPGS
jgi:hypothetical protein